MGESRRRANGPQRPSWRVERALWRAGHSAVAGVDEVGRGPLAGPVVAGAVILPYSRAAWVSRLRDSKQLTAGAREELATAILERCACSVAAVSTQVIDQIGIAPATRLAMRRAVAGLPSTPTALIVDGRESVPGVAACREQRAVIDGDALCKSVAAASIIAKVARDRLMEEFDEAFPGYGLARNKGYATSDHLSALCRLGASNIHRLSFAPVRAALRGAAFGGDALAPAS